MISTNQRIFDLMKCELGGGAPKAPPPPPPVPDAEGAASQIKEKNYGRNKFGRAQTILGGSTMGGSNGAGAAGKTILGG